MCCFQMLCLPANLAAMGCHGGGCRLYRSSSRTNFGETAANLELLKDFAGHKKQTMCFGVWHCSFLCCGCFPEDAICVMFLNPGADCVAPDVNGRKRGPNIPTGETGFLFDFWSTPHKGKGTTLSLPPLSLPPSPSPFPFLSPFGTRGDHAKGGIGIRGCLLGIRGLGSELPNPNLGWLRETQRKTEFKFGEPRGGGLSP